MIYLKQIIRGSGEQHSCINKSHYWIIILNLKNVKNLFVIIDRFTRLFYNKAHTITLKPNQRCLKETNFDVNKLL